MRTELSYRRRVGDKVLVYLKEHKIATCGNSYKMLRDVSNAINEPLYVVWKSYELLRIMARLELNSPNGRRGFRVLDYTPLAVALPDRPNVAICEVQHCPILRALRRKFPSLNEELLRNN